MSSMRKTRTVSVSIDCPPDDVAAFASSPENLPKWAAAFAHSVRRSGDDWLVETPAGEIAIRFVACNEFGVLDHVVTLSSGESVTNPMRVVPNGEGSEVMFTLFQASETSEQEFAADAAMVQRDLQTLKIILEGRRHENGSA